MKEKTALAGGIKEQTIKDYKLLIGSQTIHVFAWYKDKMYLDKNHRGLNPSVTNSSAAETYRRLIHTVY
jgi:hypothetical protein